MYSTYAFYYLFNKFLYPNFVNKFVCPDLLMPSLIEAAAIIIASSLIVCVVFSAELFVIAN